MKKKLVNKHDKTKKQEPTKALSSSQSSMTMIWITALLVALITFLAYLPALQNGFVNWDDNLYVYESQNIQSFDFRFLKWASTAVVAALWHPLTLVSLALDYAMWGLNPWGYHLTNITIHSLNTFLVFILIVRLIEYGNLWKDHKKALITAFITSLLFGIHPLHVESVAWVSERKDVLSAFFFLLTLLSYIKYISYPDSKRFKYYGLSIVFFILALMSKPMVVTLPMVLLILDYYPLKRMGIENAKTTILEKLPFFVVSFLTALITLWAHKTSGALPTLEIFSLIMRILSAVHAYIFYLFKMLVPLNLAPFYPYPTETGLFTIGHVCSYTLFLVVNILAIRSLRKNGPFPSIWLYYFITLIPVIGLIQVGKQAAADRYTYLPSLSPLFLVGLMVGSSFGGLLKRKHQITFAIVVIFIVGILTVKTREQIDIWHDSITLWSHEIKLFPEAATAFINRGKAFADAGNYQKAISDYDKSIEIDPLRFEAYHNLGTAFQRLAKYQEAIENFDRAIKLNPRFARSFNNLGSVYSDLGNQQQSIINYSKAIELDPQFADAYYNLGNVNYALGNYHQAIKNYNKVIEINPRYADAYGNRGVAFEEIGEYQQAIRDYKQTVTLKPENAIAYYNLGLLYSELGEPEQGFIYYKRAADLGLKEAKESLR